MKITASSRKIVEIQKVWFHGNVTSHFTSLSERISHLRNEKETGPSFAKTSGTVPRDRKKAYWLIADRRVWLQSVLVSKDTHRAGPFEKPTQ